MKIRIAMQGVAKSGMAGHVNDVVAGVRLPWIEIGEHRIAAADGLVSATFEAHHDSMSATCVVLEVLGPVELVYTDSDGKVLPGQPLPVPAPKDLGHLGANTIVRKEEVEG